LRFVPRQQRLHGFGQMPKLVFREIARRATAEINEVRVAPTNKFFAGVDSQFRKQRVEVAAHGGGILVRIDLEVTEVAALPAERKEEIASPADKNGLLNHPTQVPSSPAPTG